MSPVYKGGYGAKDIDGVQATGDELVFGSTGTFVNSPSASPFHFYRATRVAGVEWKAVALNPPASLSPDPLVVGLTPSLEATLWELPLRARDVALAGLVAKESQLYRGMNGEFYPVGPVLKREDEQPVSSATLGEAYSDDLCHFVMQTEALVPQAVGAARQLYDIDSCVPSSSPRLVVVTNGGALLSPTCNPRVGAGGGSINTNAMSADGDTVFFSVFLPSGANCANHNYQLFARVGNERTLEISKPLGETCLEVPCPGDTRASAIFRGASADGSKVFFLTSARLALSDTDDTTDLYEATIGCPVPALACTAGQRVVTSLVQVSHDEANPGEAAEVQGVVAASNDGSHVYFVAHGVLSTEGPVSEGTRAVPVAGADNLYSYEHDSEFPNGRTIFIGDICSGPGESGLVADARCPTSLEAGTSNVTERNDSGLYSFAPPAQTAGPDGGVLVFSTYAQLIDSGPEADTNNAQDVYRFDTATGSMRRVSVGESGYDANGNEDDVSPIGSSGGLGPMENSDARIQSLVTGVSFLGGEEQRLVRQAADETASRIVFTTARRLSPDASNGLPDIYEWHDGSVALISTGSSVEADELPVITPSGADVFFVTSQGLVSQDTDGAPDVYDARVGGGFPLQPTPLALCRENACQGPLSTPAPVLVPGSASQVAGENLQPTSKVTQIRRVTKKKKPKPTKRKLRGRRASSRGGAAGGGAR